MTRCEGFMDDDTFKRIIHNVSEINAKNMVVGNFDFSAFGEALLHPKFFEYVEYAKDHLGKVIISAATNGMLLTGENRKRIIQSKLSPHY